MNGFVAGIITGGVVVGPTVWACVRWQLETAEHAERRARAIRDQAAEIEASAATLEHRAWALITDTAEYQVIKPSVRVRVGHALTDLRDWAAGLGPDTSPDWAPGEVLALTQRPPVRRRGQVHPSRRSWPLIELLPPPTPLEVARRLACLKDPSRAFRIITVRTS